MANKQYLVETNLPYPTGPFSTEPLDDLCKDETAKRNRPPPVGWCDKSMLSHIMGTDLAVWYGRRADGRFHPHGKVMLIKPSMEKGSK